MHVVVSLMVIFIVPQLGFTLSLSWVTPGHVFYHCMSTGERVPAILLGSSPQPRDFLRINMKLVEKQLSTRLPSTTVALCTRAHSVAPFGCFRRFYLLKQAPKNHYGRGS